MRSYDEPIVSCPFNPEHKMKKSRLIWHIGKGCKEKLENEHLYGVCTYNALHIMKKELLNDHLATCPDKVKYTVFETKEDELIRALDNDLTVEESKDGFQCTDCLILLPNNDKIIATKDPWTTNIQLMNQYEIKDWYSESYNPNYQAAATQNVLTQEPGDMEIESQKGWMNVGNDGWGDDNGWNNNAWNQTNNGFGGVAEEKPMESANVGTW